MTLNQLSFQCLIQFVSLSQVGTVLGAPLFIFRNPVCVVLGQIVQSVAMCHYCKASDIFGGINPCQVIEGKMVHRHMLYIYNMDKSSNPSLENFQID